MTAPLLPTAADPVRWGFLGAGAIARDALAPVVHGTAAAVLQAAGARDRDRAAALGPVTAYGSYEQVLADDAVEAVYIALANDAHLPWTLAALEAGKAVLCEKPLGLTADEVDAMAEASARTGLPVVEASWYRWHPRVRLAQQRLAEVGAVTHVAAGFTAALDLTDNYRLQPELGGGALYDLGCYAVSAVLWAVGRGLPDEVAARSMFGPTGVDLATEALLSWDAGEEGGAVEAEVRADVVDDRGQWLIVTGTRGELELRGTPYTARHDEVELWVSDGRDTERVVVPGADPYRLMVEEVSSVLRGGPGWLLPLSESRSTAAVLDAARASEAGGGQPVRPADRLTA